MTTLGQSRQMLADLDTGSARCDGLKLAPIFRRSVGLQGEAILLGEAAGQENVNGGAGLGGRCLGSERAQSGQMIHSQPEETDSASLEHHSPRKPRMSEDRARWMH